MGEVELAALLCAFLSGSEAETRSYFDANGKAHHVRIDCETETHVIEIGLDNKSGARDSVHQALFYEYLTEKRPMVVIIDRDGVEDRYQYELRVVADRLGVDFAVCSAAFVQRWALTAPWRAAGRDAGTDDLPVEAAVQAYCDLGPVAVLTN